jgi:hypothetical protein
VHATLGVIHLIREEYDDSVFMYEYVVELTPEDGLSQYPLGAAYAGQAAEAQEAVQQARQYETGARQSQAGADLLQELAEISAAAEADYTQKQDKAIESLARAAALGGAGAERARPELERLYRAKNNSLAGLEELIHQKRAEPRIR